MARPNSVIKGRRKADLDPREKRAKIVVRLEESKRSKWDQIAARDADSLARWVIEVVDRHIAELEASDGKAS